MIDFLADYADLRLQNYLAFFERSSTMPTDSPPAPTPGEGIDAWVDGRKMYEAEMQDRLSAASSEIAHLRSALTAAESRVGPGLRVLIEERDAARAEVEKLRVDLERYVWNLAGCLTIAESQKPTEYSKDLALPALDAVNALVTQLAAEVARREATSACRSSECPNPECPRVREPSPS